MDNRYNGWKNWETWLFNLWYGDYFYQYADENDYFDTDLLAQFMEETVYQDRELFSNVEVTGFFDDVLTNAFREIDFEEVAKVIVDQIKSERG